jgi:hypothetical protein
VVVLAGIAAVLSYKHMFILVRRYRETSWTSALVAWFGGRDDRGLVDDLAGRLPGWAA